jgi:hypothetical protein
MKQRTCRGLPSLGPRFLGPVEILQILELGLHTLLARINHEGQTTKGQDELS